MNTTSGSDPLFSAMGPSRDVAPPSSADLAPQFPDLDIISLIGHGGMGAVYRIKRRSDGAALALKVVHPDPGHEAAFTARFAREAEALERLHHPHIIAIHAHGTTGPWCWLLMDLIEGANLREVVATGRLSPAQTLALVPPLCDALQYAHDRGVVHRDLKPENIILDADGTPHIVDFGLAKLRDGIKASTLTHTGAAMGTAHYMAPEQVANAKDVDHRADIYALGVVIYELLTGQLPLGRFESPSQKVHVDARIDEVVLKALERNPDQRWQQMQQLSQAVAAAAAATPAREVWSRSPLAIRIAVIAFGALSIGGAVHGSTLGTDSTLPVGYYIILGLLGLLLVGWLATILVRLGRTQLLWLAGGLLLGLIALLYVQSVIVRMIATDASSRPGHSAQPHIQHQHRDNSRDPLHP